MLKFQKSANLRGEKGSGYCSNHIESKYADYADRLESAIKAKCSDSNALRTYINPGPKALGMEVKQSQYQQCLYSSMVSKNFLILYGGDRSEMKWTGGVIGIVSGYLGTGFG